MEILPIISCSPRKAIWPRLACNALAVAFITAATLLIFSRFYSGSVSRHEPLGYDGDSLSVLAHIKASEEGGMKPLFQPVKIARLNAPYEAWWSDAPISKCVYWLPSRLSRFYGTFDASTWFVGIALCGAGITFYFSALALGGARIPSAAMGVLFALLPYGFVRNIEHLTLTLYFVVPVYILCVARLWGPEGATRSTKGIILMGVAVLLCSLFNPYYWAMFLVLLGFVGLGHLANKSWRGISATLVLGFSASLGFVLQNFDTFYFRWVEGANKAVISRDLWWMTKFGLYLPDLVLPPTHRWEAFQQLAGRDYHWKIPIQLQGESQTAYIGIIAVLGLGILMVGGLIRASAGRKSPQSPLFWFALIIFCFAVVGGANYLLGALGFQMLRATNRYSIFLAAIGLLYLVILLSRLSDRKILLTGICCVIVPIGLWDQIPRVPEWLRNQRSEAMDRFHMDSEFFPLMEKSLPAGASVFELPVMPFPENGPINNMGDYEHFRPYLHTKAMKFSYGTVKGRQHGLWQQELVIDKPADLLAVLRNKNFDAILINRRAYPDGGTKLEDDLEKNGASKLMENRDFYILRNR